MLAAGQAGRQPAGRGRASGGDHRALTVKWMAKTTAGVTTNLCLCQQDAAKVPSSPAAKQSTRCGGGQSSENPDILLCSAAGTAYTMATRRPPPAARRPPPSHGGGNGGKLMMMLILVIDDDDDGKVSYRANSQHTMAARCCVRDPPARSPRSIESSLCMNKTREFERRRVPLAVFSSTCGATFADRTPPGCCFALPARASLILRVAPFSALDLQPTAST